MALTLDEFKERLAMVCDPDIFIDVLEIGTEELMEAFEDRLADNLDKFESIYDMYGEEYGNGC